MSQEKIRLQVFFMKKWKSYSEIAEAVKINKHTFYGWLDGNFNLSEEQLQRLQEYITNFLLDKTPGANRYKTVRNLVSLFGEYKFRDGEGIAELSQYDSDERYYITSYGVCLSLCGNRWIVKKAQVDDDGYLYVDLYHKGERTRRRIHQLVIEAFKPEIDLTDKVIHHIDENRQNNLISNLLPMTREEHTEIHKYLNSLKEENK